MAAADEPARPSVPSGSDNLDGTLLVGVYSGDEREWATKGSCLTRSSTEHIRRVHVPSSVPVKATSKEGAAEDLVRLIGLLFSVQRKGVNQLYGPPVSDPTPGLTGAQLRRAFVNVFGVVCEILPVFPEPGQVLAMAANVFGVFPELGVIALQLLGAMLEPVALVPQFVGCHGSSYAVSR
jgi:hypothetical protein